MIKHRNFIGFLLLFILLIFLFAIDIIWGSVKIPIEELSKENSLYREIIYNFRLPKSITAIVVGAAISVAGLIMQTLFHNPLAGPYVLGVSSGASLGVAFFLMGGTFFSQLLLFQSSIGLIVSATMGAIFVLLLVLIASYRLKKIESLLIVGIMFGQIASSLVTILQNNSNPDSLKLFIVWSFGSLSAVSWTYMKMMLPVVLVGLFIVFFLQKSLNAFLLGESYAQGLGFSIEKIRWWVIIAVALLAGGTTAFTGPIAFIGMAVPHLARRIFKTSDHKITIPASMLCGGILLLLCDLVCQMPTNGHILPINAVSALVGAPVIIWVILKGKH